MLENKINADFQLLAIAKEPHELAEKDLVVNKIPKSITDLVKTTWHINSASGYVCCEKTIKIQIVKALLLSS